MGAAVFCGLALLCFVTGPLLARLEVLPPMAALGLLALAAGLGLVSAELGLVAVLVGCQELLDYWRMRPLTRTPARSKYSSYRHGAHF